MTPRLCTKIFVIIQGGAPDDAEVRFMPMFTSCLIASSAVDDTPRSVSIRRLRTTPPYRQRRWACACNSRLRAV